MTDATLRDLGLADAYRSNASSLARDFLVPALSVGASYDRGAGYFTSSSLALVMTGLGPFLRRDGTIRIVASPWLTERDIEAMRDVVGEDEVDAAVEQRLRDELQQMIEAPIAPHKLFAWLLASGRLQIKIAILVGAKGIELYHEKFGVIRDGEANRISFTGSANETYGGLQANFESIEVFRSWDDGDARRVARREAEFEDLWNDRTSGLRVIPLADALRDDVIKAIAPRDDSGELLDADAMTAELEASEWGQVLGLDRPGTADTLSLPAKYTPLREHQDEALAEWWKERGRGVLAMATGAGKTVTALAGAARVLHSLQSKQPPSPLVVLIVCPYRHLVRQWAEDIEKFGASPLICDGSSAWWAPRLRRGLEEIDRGRRSTLVVAVTNAALLNPRLAVELGRLRAPALIVGDEVHNLGARQLAEALPSRVAMRMGLSATPERWMDEEGTAAIEEYFGPTVYSYTLDDAIEDETLVPYRYYPRIVRLDDDEMDQYRELSIRIAQLVGGGRMPAADEDHPAQHLLIQRARLLAAARGKLPLLRAELSRLDPAKRVLVYCGDGVVERESDGQLVRQLDEVIRTCRDDLGLRCVRFTHETHIDDRKQIGDDLAAGTIDVVASIRCLDEGVDIPAASTAILLASSTNPRQYVQRRGRVLRRAEGKREALIIDAVVAPSNFERLPADARKSEQRLLARELRRVFEFARPALNAETAIDGPMRELAIELDIPLEVPGHGLEATNT